jgi:uncharacterized protein YjcR
MMDGKKKRLIRAMRQNGRTYGEIGDATGLSPNTVKSFCRRENIGAADASGDDPHDSCKHCGRPLAHHPGRKKKRFCNDACRTAWWNRNRGWARRKKAHRSVCRRCGEGLP